MESFTKELLDLIKKRYIAVAGPKEFQNTTEARRYNLESFEDNLYKPMSQSVYDAYGKGSGNEISSGKMNSVRSSSALTYNLFWRERATVSDSFFPKYSMKITPGKYDVEFEKTYHTLKTTVSNRPAHLDAFLYNSDNSEAIAIEVKMTEWIFNKPGNLKAAYLDENSYINKEAGKVFVSIARNLIGNTDYDFDTESADYPSFTVRYDAFQMFKHTVACYTACVSEEKRPVKKLTLLNIIWDLARSEELPSDESMRIYDEIAATERFELDLFFRRMEPVKKLFEDIGVKFEFKAIKMSDIPVLFEYDDDELKYLKRYIDEDRIERLLSSRNSVNG